MVEITTAYILYCTVEYVWLVNQLQVPIGSSLVIYVLLLL